MAYAFRTLLVACWIALASSPAVASDTGPDTGGDTSTGVSSDTGAARDTGTGSGTSGTGDTATDTGSTSTDTAADTGSHDTGASTGGTGTDTAAIDSVRSASLLAGELGGVSCDELAHPDGLRGLGGLALFFGAAILLRRGPS